MISTASWHMMMIAWFLKVYLFRLFCNLMRCARAYLMQNIDVVLVAMSYLVSLSGSSTIKRWNNFSSGFWGFYSFFLVSTVGNSTFQKIESLCLVSCYHCDDSYHQMDGWYITHVLFILCHYKEITDSVKLMLGKV